MWSRYSRLLESRPLTTKVVTSAAVTGTGDLSCQLVLEGAEELDVKRLSTFTTLGGLLVAPTLHNWYSWLHRAFPGGGATAVAKRLAFDQTLFAPFFIPVFMSSVLLIEGHPQPRAKVAQDWWPAVVTNWKLWVPAQVINFGLVPLPYQVLFANGVALAWNAYLSHTSHSRLRESDSS